MTGLQFRQRDDVDGGQHTRTIRVPAPAPIAPLAVSNAEFQLEMAVRKIGRYARVRRRRSELRVQVVRDQQGKWQVQHKQRPALAGETVKEDPAWSRRAMVT